ncbi:MAG: ribulose-phosphate 3-epimerase [Deltaproteobacteria bacterium]|nr:ribulose-phosphate 3-epimerase [Deltaproteobacteria bacterium]MBI3386408.1 ribulose-phosphate 3-epimerase [Deltaproteobacteria bacterium]
MSSPPSRILIAPSMLSADFARLGEEVRAVDAAGADFIHLDVMDGHFVPNLTIGPLVVEAVRPHTKLPLDVHLMIEEPERYIKDFAAAGANYLSVHQEACPHLHAVVQQIRAAGVKPAVVINPATPLSAVEPILADVDMLLIMTVNPGFGGQQFIESTKDKIRAARDFKRARGLSFLIEVDGGVKMENAAAVIAAGAEVLVSGSGVFGTKDYRATIAALRGSSQ